MGQFDDIVERQRKLIQAEKWSKKVKGVHAHSLTSMWYDNRPEDTAEGKSVIDIEYNGGLIERTLSSGKVIYFGQRLRGDALIREWEAHEADNRRRYVYN